jgi:hypothetical protein
MTILLLWRVHDPRWEGLFVWPVPTSQTGDTL